MKNNRLNLVCLTLVMASATVNAFHGGGGGHAGHMSGMSHSGGALDHSGHMNHGGSRAGGMSRRGASPIGAHNRQDQSFDGHHGHRNHRYGYNNNSLLATGADFGVSPLIGSGYYGYRDYPYDDYDDNGYNDYSYDY